jgi:hypothetical protein
MAKYRKGVYHARYIVATWDDAARIITGMEQSVASSFGEGDDQWSGIDLTDHNAKVTLTKLSPGRVAVDVEIPVDVVPDDYWLSPYCTDEVNVQTFTTHGGNGRCEAAEWGMRFPARKVRKVAARV